MSCERCPQCEYCGAYRLGEWTTEPPTEPGWYWVWPRADGLIGSALFVHKLGNREIVLGEFHFDNGLSAPLRNAAAWQRIDPPEVPK